MAHLPFRTRFHLNDSIQNITIWWKRMREREREKRGKIVKSGWKSFSLNFYEGWTLNVYGVCLTNSQVPSGLWLVNVTHLFYSIHFTWKHIPFNYRITVCYFYDCRDHRPTNEQWTMSIEHHPNIETLNKMLRWTETTNSTVQI